MSWRWWIEVGERRQGEVWEQTRMLAFSRRRSQSLLHRLTDSCNQLDLQRLVMSDSQNCKLLQDRKRWAWNSDSIKPSWQSRARACTWPAPIPDLETARFVLLCFFGQKLFFPFTESLRVLNQNTNLKQYVAMQSLMQSFQSLMWNRFYARLNVEQVFGCQI